MEFIKLTSENWENSKSHARKTKNGNYNMGDMGEYAIAEAWGAEWLNNKDTPGSDVIKAGMRYEIKTNCGNQAAFGQRFVAKSQTVMGALKTYFFECEKASDIPFGGFVVCDSLEVAKVMTPMEFIEYARERLVYKAGSGSKGLAWKLQKNVYTERMRNRLESEGRL